MGPAAGEHRDRRGSYVAAEIARSHLARKVRAAGTGGVPRSLWGVTNGRHLSQWAPRALATDRDAPLRLERREACHCRAGDDPVGVRNARLTRSAFSGSVSARMKEAASDSDGHF